MSPYQDAYNLDLFIILIQKIGKIRERGEKDDQKSEIWIVQLISLRHIELLVEGDLQYSKELQDLLSTIFDLRRVAWGVNSESLSCLFENV
jgi:hypothetical protein